VHERIIATMRYLLLIAIAGCALATEPNRYYQIVSNHLVDALAEHVDDAALSPEVAEAAIAYAIEKTGSHGAIVSRSPVEERIAAGLELLRQPRLTAIDKCIEMIHDIDVAAAYWSVDDPRAPNPNTPAVVQGMNEANAKHRIKIDGIKAVLARTPATPAAIAATALAVKLADDQWVGERRAQLQRDLRSAGRKVPADLVEAIASRLTGDALRRPLVLELMKRFSVEEMDGLRALPDASIEVRALRAMLAMAPEVAVETESLLMIEAKAYALRQAASGAPVAQAPVAQPPVKAAGGGGPGYADVRPVVEAALRALDAGDMDALFKLVLPRDLAELDAQGLAQAKQGLVGERSAAMRTALAGLASIAPIYHATTDSLEFPGQGPGGSVHFQRVEGTWYLTNHPPRDGR
jgi:hypothetical protein